MIFLWRAKIILRIFFSLSWLCHFGVSMTQSKQSLLLCTKFIPAKWIVGGHWPYMRNEFASSLASCSKYSIKNRAQHIQHVETYAHPHNNILYFMYRMYIHNKSIHSYTCIIHELSLRAEMHSILKCEIINMLRFIYAGIPLL